MEREATHGLRATEEDRRKRLRVLDACLECLEDANERDERRVSIAIASRVNPVVPSVIPGLSIRDAIDHVLQEQERHLLAMSDEVTDCYALESAPGHPPPRVLDESEARALTTRIKDAAQQMALLLLEAYERRAAPALGYPTWEAYVQGEFGLSRSRSYELLDQGRVMRALQAAAQMSGVPDISSRAAFDVKPYLNELIETVRERAAGSREEDVPGIVTGAVQEVRSRVRGEAAEPPAGWPRPADRDDRPTAAVVDHPSRAVAANAEHVRAVISILLNMPPPADALASVLAQEETQPLDDLVPAVRWLVTFARCWAERSGRNIDISWELTGAEEWAPAALAARVRKRVPSGV